MRKFSANQIQQLEKLCDVLNIEIPEKGEFNVLDFVGNVNNTTSDIIKGLTDLVNQINTLSEKVFKNGQAKFYANIGVRGSFFVELGDPKYKDAGDETLVASKPIDISVPQIEQAVSNLNEQVNKIKYSEADINKMRIQGLTRIVEEYDLDIPVKHSSNTKELRKLVIEQLFHADAAKVEEAKTAPIEEVEEEEELDLDFEDDVVDDGDDELADEDSDDEESDDEESDEEESDDDEEDNEDEDSDEDDDFNLDDDEEEEEEEEVQVKKTPSKKSKKVEIEEDGDDDLDSEDDDEEDEDEEEEEVQKSKSKKPSKATKKSKDAHDDDEDFDLEDVDDIDSILDDMEDEEDADDEDEDEDEDEESSDDESEDEDEEDEDVDEDEDDDESIIEDKVNTLLPLLKRNPDNVDDLDDEELLFLAKRLKVKSEGVAVKKLKRRCKEALDSFVIETKKKAKK